MKNYELEKINYSQYTPNLTIEVDKYISENEGALNGLLSRAVTNETSLLIAPTGSGKTYSIIKLLKMFDEVSEIKSIFIVPNSIQVEQIKIEYNIPGACGDVSVLSELEKGNVIALTWDKFVQIPKETLSEYIVILDEVHQTYVEMFRLNKINKVYDNLKACLGQIHITATPNKLNFDNYSHIVEYKQKEQTNYEVKIYDKICDDTILSIVKKSKKFALLKDDTNYLNFIKENNPTRPIDVISSNIRDYSEAYKEIVTNGTMKSVNGIVNTSVLLAGVNIKEPEITDIIVIGVKDKATIKQYIARFRDLETVRVHIFNTYKSKEESKIYSIEWLIEQKLKEAYIQVEGINAINNPNKFKELEIELTPIRIDSDNRFYWSDEEQKHLVNEIAIRNQCYVDYYNKADIEMFKISLEEYFPNVEIISIQEANNVPSKTYNKIATEEKKQILEILSQNKAILVGANEILTNKVSPKLEGYLFINGLEVEEVKSQLIDLGLMEHVLVGNIAKLLNLYSKYVIENGYNYELAWCLANKGNRARGKFFGQLNNFIYREIETKYPKLMRYIRIEDRVYNYIINHFIPGISYTEEHLKDFVEAIQITLGIRITTNKLSEILGQIYNIESKQYKKGSKVPPIDFIFNKIYNSNHGTFDKKTNIYTIKSYLTLEDVINQNSLDELSLKVLKSIVKDRIESIEKETVTITDMTKLAFGESFSWCS